MYDVEPDSQSLMLVSSSAPSPAPDSVPVQGDLNCPAAPATNADSHPSSDMPAETAPRRQPTDGSPPKSDSLAQPLSALLIEALSAATQEHIIAGEEKPGHPDPPEALFVSSAIQQATRLDEDDGDFTLVNEILQRQQATMAQIKAHMLMRPQPWWRFLLADKVCLFCKHLTSSQSAMLLMAFQFQSSKLQCSYW